MLNSNVHEPLRSGPNSKDETGLTINLNFPTLLYYVKKENLFLSLIVEALKIEMKGAVHIGTLFANSLFVRLFVVLYPYLSKSPDPVSIQSLNHVKGRMSDWFPSLNENLLSHL